MKNHNIPLVSIKVLCLSLMMACSASNVSQSVNIGGSTPQVSVTPSSAPVASATPSNYQSPNPQPVDPTIPDNSTPDPVISPSPTPSDNQSPEPQPVDPTVPNQSPSPGVNPPVNPEPTPEKTPTSPNGTYTHPSGMHFVTIPAGSFQMGQADGAESHKPVHTVTLSSFQIMTTEVTQKHWSEVVGEWPEYSPSSAMGAGDNYPMYYVSWNDAQTFIQQLNQRGDGTYRLPTEAEWEYAARAGTSSTYACGEYVAGDNGCPGSMAWFFENNGAPSGTKPVATKQPNAWGLYDMHGNVGEWVQDWHGPYSSSPITNPKGPNGGSGRVHRGGDWFGDAYAARSAFRHNSGGNPTVRVNRIGFRVVRIP